MLNSCSTDVIKAILWRESRPSSLKLDSQFNFLILTSGKSFKTLSVLALISFNSKKLSSNLF
jgi:hypothetical protein